MEGTYKYKMSIKINKNKKIKEEVITKKDKKEKISRRGGKICIQ
ncbi:hypothetical protein Metvu_1477 [Methanocaldococcus vulcanius M7]|uniref:Uncharacterized protein n=1 Tax=Methanocaldococcus vulcanius (strain ATCC 700851 / DSM 12094 / M7) TaxID=579137 RepID=C9RIC8_METVM|nr:hypothetical protein Metvu_1477 [Methanocaldococcus vulcanius M7]